MTDKYDPYWPTGLGIALVVLNVFLGICLIAYGTLVYFDQMYVPTLMMYSLYPISTCCGVYIMLTLHPRERLLKLLQIFLALLSFIVLCFFLNELAGSNIEKYDGTYTYPKLKNGTIVSITASTDEYPSDSNVPVMAGLVGVSSVALIFSMIHFLFPWKFFLQKTAIDYSDPFWPEFAQYMFPVPNHTFKFNKIRYGASVIVIFIFIVMFVQSVLSFWLLFRGYILMTPFPNLLVYLYFLLPVMLFPPSNVPSDYLTVPVEGKTYEEILRYDEKYSRKEFHLGVWRFHVYVVFLFIGIVNCITGLIDTNAWRNTNGILSEVGECNATAFTNVMQNSPRLDFFSGEQYVTFTLVESVSGFDLNTYAAMNCLDDWLNITVICLSSIVWLLHMLLYCT